MKITNITPYSAEFTSQSKSSLSHPKKWVFVKIDTDEGIHGWGEIGKGSSVSEKLMSTAVNEVTELFIGENPMDTERLWHKLFRKFSYVGSKGFTTSLIAGFDIALWDVKGKYSNMPIYNLLGGRFRNPVRLYCNSWFDGCDTPEDYAKAAKTNLLEKGYSACKLDPFLEMVPFHTMYQDGFISQEGEEEGYEIVSAVRDVVGPKFEILIDAHGHYNVPNAIRLANNLYERFKIGWFEEPLPPESIKGLKQVKENTDAPICVGERLYTRYDFLPVLENGLADYIMPDTVWTGGISETIKIANMAETYNVPVSPHVIPGGPIELISAAHVVSAIPNFYRLEHSLSLISDHNNYLKEPYEIKNGHFYLNNKPGLGFELNEEKLEKLFVK
ncbi:MAG TPA: mandelate racemase/muconate lactonizing enzyme family protein [Dehalococcoidia bacterium]|nr:mandelate racemase/muconate lactonizing enzyme family protein [Dehalococcoidia bacterium]